MTRWSRAHATSDSGATLVEFAVVIPVFMMLIIGLFTGANLVNRQIQVSHAARNGASYGASLNLQSGWAAAVQSRIASTAVRDFPTSAICVALVTGPGNSPTLVTSGTPLDPSTRVVVRVNVTGTLDWVFGGTTQNWISTSTALWEPYAQYSGATGIPSTYTSADLSTGSAAGDPTCKGAAAASGTNQYAFVPGVTATTTTLPPATTVCVPTNIDMTSLQGIQRNVPSGVNSGDNGTTLTTRRGTCSVGVNVTWAIAAKTASWDAAAATADRDNLTVVNTNWGAGSPVVMLSNLNPNYSSNNSPRTPYGTVDMKLSFSTPVSNLTFDVLHLAHQRAYSSERYTTVALSNILNAGGGNISDANQARSGIYNYSMSCLPGASVAGNTPPCALNKIAGKSDGPPDGSPAKPWAANDPGSGANLVEYLSNLNVSFKVPVTSLDVQFGIVNSQDNGAYGWNWGSADRNPTYLDGTAVPSGSSGIVCVNNQWPYAAHPYPATGNPCMQIGLANMSFAP